MSEREMSALIALLERQLGVSWTDIVEWLREQNGIDAIEARLIERGIGGGFLTSTEGLLVDIETAYIGYADDIHAAYVQAGQRAAGWLDDRIANKLLRFDQMNYRAVARAQANRYELVQGLSDESREVVSRVVSEGLEAGINPRAMAREIRDSIGLTPKQAEHVANYRRALADGDFSRALRYELRDGRSDRTLRRLMRDGGELDPAQLEAMVDRYRKNYVAFRAKTIARAEALRAAHEGAEDMYAQAISRGDLDPEDVTRTWNSRSPSKRAREQHQEMDEQHRPWGVPFEAPDGTLLRYPGDPNAGARHTANCGCAVSTTLSLRAAA